MAVASIVVAALLAGCGSSAPAPHAAGSASAQGLTSAQGPKGQEAMLRFAGCMRSRGIAAFPDPGTPAFKQAFAAQSPAFRSAYPGCRRLLPGGGPQSENKEQSPAQIAAIVAFARCLRGHGFPTFPDPSTTGQLTHEMLAAAGINLHQPAVERVADACTGVTHGAVTTADVARFIAGR